MRALILAAMAVSLGCPGAPAAPATGDSTAKEPIERFVRSRCATDGRDTWVSWAGQVHADVAGDPPRHLFDVVGVSAARCGQLGDGTWYLASRELMLYLDPATGAPLHRWRNPWTGAEVTVVHVANDPVQSRLPRSIPAVRDGADTRFVIDIPLRYPNSLAGDPRLRRYSPDPVYRARERFELVSPTSELVVAPTAAMELSWDREGPWLPWMDMGERPGRLVYRARGAKRAGFAAVPAALRAEIEQRLPAYRRAPRCLTDRPNVTSWSYFAAHFEDYLAGARFPLPAPASDGDCP